MSWHVHVPLVVKHERVCPEMSPNVRNGDFPLVFKANPVPSQFVAPPLFVKFVSPDGRNSGDCKVEQIMFPLILLYSLSFFVILVQGFPPGSTGFGNLQSWTNHFVQLCVFQVVMGKVEQIMILYSKIADLLNKNKFAEQICSTSNKFVQGRGTNLFKLFVILVICSANLFHSFLLFS